MADVCAIEVVLWHGDGSSAVPSASKASHSLVRAGSRMVGTESRVVEVTQRSDGSGPDAATPTPLVEAIVRSLCARLGEGSNRAHIAGEVEAELSTYANARVTHFISILVESRVWARLRRPLSASSGGDQEHDRVRATRAAGAARSSDSP